MGKVIHRNHSNTKQSIAILNKTENGSIRCYTSVSAFRMVKKESKYCIIMPFYVSTHTRHTPNPLPIFSKLQHNFNPLPLAPPDPPQNRQNIPPNRKTIAPNHRDFNGICTHTVYIFRRVCIITPENNGQREIFF